MEIAPILNQLKDLDERRAVLVDYLDYPVKKERLEEVSRELEAPSVWDDPDNAQALGRERASLEAVVETLETLQRGIADNRELLEMAVEEDDQDTVDEVQTECDALDAHLAKLEFRRM
ncbi:MAG: PCRF domain-containing protein, partial [Litorivicinus sp.]